MSKNYDMILILLIVVTGMFIPFLVSITIVFGFNIQNILSTFGWFIVVFAIELAVVYLYFIISNWYAMRKFDKLAPKNKNPVDDKE